MRELICARFQSTLPVWEETCGPTGADGDFGTFQSTLPVWEETTATAEKTANKGFQSTLPVWEETRSRRYVFVFRVISIHSPRVGRDGIIWCVCSCLSQFQSTLPVWEETSSIFFNTIGKQFQSTLPVWEETIRPPAWKACNQNFNPLSPCGKRPHHNPASIYIQRRFQSTLPVWEETRALGTPFRS